MSVASDMTVGKSDEKGMGGYCRLLVMVGMGVVGGRRQYPPSLRPFLTITSEGNERSE